MGKENESVTNKIKRERGGERKGELTIAGVAAIKERGQNPAMTF